MKAVKDFVEEAMSNGYNVELLDGGIYRIDYPLTYEDGNRFQCVYVRDLLDDQTQKQSYFMNSYICDFTSKVNISRVLREANYGKITMICLKSIPDGHGSQKEALYTQTTIPSTYLNDDYNEFMSVVFEVAANADYIEKIFHPKDMA
jgi:hypothetical protein